MKTNGVIITQIGTNQKLFKDRETYPKYLCDDIEDLISCNISKLHKYKGVGRIRFLDRNSSLILQLVIEGSNSSLSSSDKAVILLRLNNGVIKSPVYYGVDCDIDFNYTSNECALNSVDGCIDALKNFYNSWVLRKGEVGVVVVIVDNYSVYERVIDDDFFKYSYVLYSE